MTLGVYMECSITQRSAYHFSVLKSALVQIRNGRIVLGGETHTNAWQATLCVPDLSEVCAFGYLEFEPTDEQLGQWLCRALNMLEETETQCPQVICVETYTLDSYPCVEVIAEAAGKELWPVADPYVPAHHGARADELLLGFWADVRAARLPDLLESELWLPDGFDVLLGTDGADEKLTSYLRVNLLRQHARYLRRVQRCSASKAHVSSRACHMTSRDRIPRSRITLNRRAARKSGNQLAAENYSF
jgi:hypothetical protein